MNNRLRAVLVLSLAVACVLATATAGAAKTTHSKLRVEAIGKTLDPGFHYSNASIRTRNSDACGERDSRRERLRGPNAMGLVGHASRFNRRLRPFRTSDTFGFGLIVCRIDAYKGFGNRAWLYKVNHVSPPVGADQRRVGRGDEVLWYFANFSTGRNTGDELALRGVPVAATPGERFEVQALAYDGNGDARPAADVRVRSAAEPTAADGTTTVTARSTPGTMAIRGARGNDIPSEQLAVCVKRNLSRCPERRGGAFVGTGRPDAIRASGGPDLIRARDGRDNVRARRGDDLIDVRRGRKDRVNCGAGHDKVRADRRDSVASNCEVVRH